MSKLTYVTDEGGDWAALYIDGKLAEDVEQNHSLNTGDVIEAIAKRFNAEYEHFETDSEWQEKQGWLPDDLNNIPADARRSY